MSFIYFDGVKMSRFVFCIYLQIHLSNTKRFTVSLYFLCFVFPEIVLFNFNLVFIQLFKTTIPFVIIINSQWSLRDDFVIIYYYTKNDINLEIPGNGLFRFNSLYRGEKC